MKNYPQALLPQPHFKIIKNIDKIRKGYLIHFTDTRNNQDEGNKLKLECVVRHTDHLRDYSNNLLGAFETSHIYLSINSNINDGYFIELWKVGSSVEVPLYPKDFDFADQRGYFFLKISDLHDNIVEYNDEPKIKAQCKVIHTPTNFNFWHISLRWFHEDQDIHEWGNKKRGTQRRILTAAKSLIIEKAKFDEPGYSEWDESIYT